MIAIAVGILGLAFLALLGWIASDPETPTPPSDQSCNTAPSPSGDAHDT